MLRNTIIFSYLGAEFVQRVNGQQVFGDMTLLGASQIECDEKVLKRNFWECYLEGEHPGQQKVCHGTCEIDGRQSGRLECDCIKRMGPIVFKGECQWKTVEKPECDVLEVLERSRPESPGQMNFGYPENYGVETEIPTTEIPTTEIPTTEIPTTEMPTTTTTATTTSTTEFNVIPKPCLPYINSKRKKVPKICREYMPTTTTTSTTTTTTTTTMTTSIESMTACQAAEFPLDQDWYCDTTDFRDGTKCKMTCNDHQYRQRCVCRYGQSCQWKKTWPRCKKEAIPEMDMMNDFNSISHEMDHILEEEHLLEDLVAYEVEHEPELFKNQEESDDAVTLLHFMVAQSTSLFKSILATLNQIID